MTEHRIKSRPAPRTPPSPPGAEPEPERGFTFKGAQVDFKPGHVHASPFTMEELSTEFERVLSEYLGEHPYDPSSKPRPISREKPRGSVDSHMGPPPPRQNPPTPLALQNQGGPDYTHCFLVLIIVMLLAVLIITSL